MERSPAPIELPEVMLRAPPFSVLPPEEVFTPERVRVPEPLAVKAPAPARLLEIKTIARIG